MTTEIVPSVFSDSRALRRDEDRDEAAREVVRGEGAREEARQRYCDLYRREEGRGIVRELLEPSRARVALRRELVELSAVDRDDRYLRARENRVRDDEHYLQNDLPQYAFFQDDSSQISNRCARRIKKQKKGQAPTIEIQVQACPVFTVERCVVVHMIGCCQSNCPRRPYGVFFPFVKTSPIVG